MIRKEIRDEGAERKIKTEKGKFRNLSFVPDSIKSFRYVQGNSKSLTESPKRGWPRVNKESQ